MGSPRSPVPQATPAPEPWIGAALAAPSAVQRLQQVGIAIDRERAALEADRVAFRQAAARETGRALALEAYDLAGQLADVDDTDLIAHAPDLYRRAHRAHVEP
jgi:hypothetical protein